MAYCSLADVKAYLDIETLDTDADDILEDLIARAQQTIDRATGRTFEASADTTRYFDAVADVDGRSLWLGEGDLCQITSIMNGDGTTISADSYVTLPANVAPYHAILLKRNSGVSWTYSDSPENAIQIEGRWAYSVSAPADVQHACIRLVSFMFKQRDTGIDAENSMVTQNGIMILPSRLPKDVMSLLKSVSRLI